MAMSLATMAAVVGPPDAGRHGPALHRITPDDIAQARELRRRGWGWQNIANVLRVNQTSLRACVEGFESLAAKSRDGDADADEAEAEDAAFVGGCAFAPMAANGMLARMLLVVAAGVTGPQEAAQRIGVDGVYARKLGSRLRLRGLLGGDWRLTPSGRAEAQRVAAELGWTAADA